MSPDGYHQHFTRQAQGVERSRLSDDALLAHNKAIQAESKGRYGWPRVWKGLLARSIRVGKDRVRKLMQQHGIKARGKRRFKATTNSRHSLPVAPNLLERRFDVTATDEGWFYLAVVIDLFSRQVVGWSLGERMTRQLVMDALRMAWFRRGPDKRSSLIFHSDRGSQYCSNDFQDMLNGYGMCSSMSRKGDCWDNECSETLFGSLNVERLHGMRFETLRATKDEVIDWLLWYNCRRLHSTLGYLSPMQYEQRWLAAQPKTANM